VLEDVPDGNRQIVVGVHQPYAGRDDSVPVKVHIVSKGDIEPVLHVHQVGHGVRAGAVHSDFAVFVQGHKGESRVHAFVDDFEIESVAFRDWLPVPQTGTAQRVNADMNAAS